MNDRIPARIKNVSAPMHRTVSSFHAERQRARWVRKSAVLCGVRERAVANVQDRYDRRAIAPFIISTKPP